MPKDKDKKPGAKITKRYTFRNSELIELIRQHGGNITAVANTLGVNRSTVYKRIRKYPEIEKVIAETREANLDRVEAAMFEAAASGNITAMIFTLKTQGARRGWSENQNINIQAKVEAKTGGVRTPVEDAKYLGEVLKELRDMGLTDAKELTKGDGEVVEGVYELGDGLGVPGEDETETAPKRLFGFGLYDDEPETVEAGEDE